MIVDRPSDICWLSPIVDGSGKTSRGPKPHADSWSGNPRKVLLNYTFVFREFARKQYRLLAIVLRSTNRIKNCCDSGQDLEFDSKCSPLKCGAKSLPH
jgi:hypothetical protein